jgi:hypothetical protein
MQLLLRRRAVFLRKAREYWTTGGRGVLERQFSEGSSYNHKLGY